MKKLIAITLTILITSIYTAGAHAESYDVKGLNLTIDGQNFELKSNCRKVSGIVIKRTEANGDSTIKLKATDVVDRCGGSPQDLANLKAFFSLRDATLTIENNATEVARID